ncbi:MAG: hypothetical protein ACNA8W_07665 [Bradymonadaceae bacterium]
MSETSEDFTLEVAGETSTILESASRSQIYVTMVFMRSNKSGLHNSLPPFVDDENNTHERDIYKLWKAGLTNGCSGGAHPRYCPGRGLTRAEMAAFLRRAFNLPATSRNYFSDTRNAWYTNDVNALAADRWPLFWTGL